VYRYTYFRKAIPLLPVEQSRMCAPCHPVFLKYPIQLQMEWWKHITDLVYPPLCTSCGLLRPLDQHIFCLECLHQLPETGYHLHVQNPFMAHFAGRIRLSAGASFLFFSRGGGTQRMLHQIKYNNQPELITTIGRWYGKQLMQSDLWNGVEVIVPVPCIGESNGSAAITRVLSLEKRSAMSWASRVIRMHCSVSRMTEASPE
jgi:hypothetical protein